MIVGIDFSKALSEWGGVGDFLEERGYVNIDLGLQR
jgi:hypothetical protein